MVTTRVTPMTIDVPVAAVRPGLRTVFSRAIRASIPGHTFPKSFVAAGTMTVHVTRMPTKHSKDRPKEAKNFCDPL